MDDHCPRKCVFPDDTYVAVKLICYTFSKCQAFSQHSCPFSAWSIKMKPTNRIYTEITDEIRADNDVFFCRTIISVAGVFCSDSPLQKGRFKASLGCHQWRIPTALLL